MIRSDKGMVELKGSKAVLMVELITAMHVLHDKVDVTKDELKIAVEQACMSSEELEKSVDDAILDVISKLLAEKFAKDLFDNDTEYEDDEEDDDDEYNF